MDDDDWWEPPEPFQPWSIEVEVTDNPVVAVLYGVDGEPLIEVHERPWVPFGFQKGTA